MPGGIKTLNSGLEVLLTVPSLLHTIQIETNYNTDEQRPFLISRLTFAPPAAAAASQTDRGSQHIVMHSVRMSVNQNKAGTETKL